MNKAAPDTTMLGGVAAKLGMPSGVASVSTGCQSGLSGSTTCQRHIDSSIEIDLCLTVKDARAVISAGRCTRMLQAWAPWLG